MSLLNAGAERKGCQTGMNRVLICLLSLLVTLSTAAAASDARAWVELVAALTAEQQAQAIPVMALVLFDGGRAVHRSMHTLPGATPLEAATPLRWGSISKTVTAIALLQVARAHDVDLDSPVTWWLPAPPYHNPWANHRPMRLVHLLELTAGLPDLSRAEFGDNVPRPLAEALRRGASERIVRWPPGLQHGYSNMPPGLAAALLEQITGEPFENAVARWVFRPLGMAGASFRPEPQLPGGFKADGVTPISYWHVTFTAFGGLNASPLAMSRLLEALLNCGRVDGRQVLPEGLVHRVYRSESALGARDLNGGRDTALVPVSETQFRRHGDPVISVVFTEHCARLLLQGVLGEFVRLADQEPFGPGILNPCETAAPE